MIAGVRATLLNSLAWAYCVAPDEAAAIQVNFANCVHCRTCVIVDPCDVDGEDHFQNIEWRAPNEGGPKYLGL